MMKRPKTGWVIILSAIIFTFLFYKQALGLNLLIYECLTLGYLFYDGTIDRKNQFHLIGSFSLFLTALFTVINHSTLSVFVNFLIFFLFVGSISSARLRSIPLIAINSITSFIISQGQLWKVFQRNSEANQRKSPFSRSFKFLILPMFVIITFILIYSASNPKFSEFFEWISQRIFDLFDIIFRYIEFFSLIIFLFGLVIATFIFRRRQDSWAKERSENSSDSLIRVKKRSASKYKFLGLLNEYRSAVFLILSLNCLLLFLNVMDIYYVWFNFKWEGQYLKDFVHQGTYLLIVSILLSISLVLYFFRSNLNFFSKSERLRKLCYIWLIQNGILVISVAIRNWYYIQYYALAYKRIAIVFFLILTLVALYTVYRKLSGVKSTYYMVRTNSYALILVLISASAFNWDPIIAKYNFSKANRSFVHLNYLATLSDSSLPYLEHPLETLKEMDQKQMNKYSAGSSFDSGDSFKFYRRTYMTPEEYLNEIQYRKEKFKYKWKRKGFLSWNLAEYLAYSIM